ncbi:MAG: hypothetical protein SWY16_05865, partial [Cyanobacteriota bacterium]|nr:hypothetical protein [Cyanobacteriota bacterium]
MVFDWTVAGKAIAPLLGKVVPYIFDKVRSQVNPNEIEKALSLGIKAAGEREETLAITDRLFYRCSPDYIFGTFLVKFLTESADELQKPLNNEGEPNIQY